MKKLFMFSIFAFLASGAHAVDVGSMFKNAFDNIKQGLSGLLPRKGAEKDAQYKSLVKRCNQLKDSYRNIDISCSDLSMNGIQRSIEDAEEKIAIEEKKSIDKAKQYKKTNEAYNDEVENLKSVKYMMEQIRSDLGVYELYSILRRHPVFGKSGIIKDLEGRLDDMPPAQAKQEMLNAVMKISRAPKYCDSVWEKVSPMRINLRYTVDVSKGACPTIYVEKDSSGKFSSYFLPDNSYAGWEKSEFNECALGNTNMTDVTRAYLVKNGFPDDEANKVIVYCPYIILGR